MNLAAREALWRLGHVPLFAPALLTQLAHSESPNDRVAAAEALGSLGDREAGPVMLPHVVSSGGSSAPFHVLDLHRGTPG